MNLRRLWLWPHLLSLDAPLVAVSWQLLLARSVAPIPPVQTWILGLSVWLIYMVDRILDATRPPTPHDAPRHQFARRFRAPLLGLAVVVLAVDLVLAFGYLEQVRLARGALVLSLVAVHFFLAHRQLRPWPKELWIAVIFGTGVWLPALVAAPNTVAGIQALLFAALCWWNCVAIESWEQAAGGPPQWHGTTRWLAARLRPAAAVIALIAAGVYLRTHQPAAAAEALAGMLYWLLQGQSRDLSPDTLRLAVDLALLTPVLF